MESAEVASYWEANAADWTRLVRAGFDVSRDALNTPTFLKMLPRVRGLAGLDIGCGEGANTRMLARLGGRMQAIDIAPTFIRNAKATEAAAPLGIVYQIADALALPFANGAFDFATAFMSLMDVPDPGRALRQAARVLRPGGFLQLSILHPCFAPPHRKVVRDEDGSVCAVEIGGYFDCNDAQIDTWMFSKVPQKERAHSQPFRVPRFHRTLSHWVEFICSAGLVIEEFGEPRASLELARREPLLADTRVAPFFLLIRTRKPLAWGAV